MPELPLRATRFKSTMDKVINEIYGTEAMHKVSKRRETTNQTTRASN
jgi:hypothetical protein